MLTSHSLLQSNHKLNSRLHMGRKTLDYGRQTVSFIKTLLIKSFNRHQRHPRCVISVLSATVATPIAHRDQRAVGCSRTLYSQRSIARTLESTEGPARPTLTTLSIIVHKNDDAFRHFHRRRKSTHVAANHSTTLS